MDPAPSIDEMPQSAISQNNAANSTPAPPRESSPSEPVAMEHAQLGILAIQSSQPLSEVDRRRHVIGCLTAISRALETYRAAHGRYPNPCVHGSDDEPALSWRVALLPLLGYDDLHKQFKLDQSWDSAHNRQLLRAIPPVYQSPERGDERTNFLLFVGEEAAYRRQYGIGPATDNFTGGVENTLVLAECDDAAAVPWTQPTDFAVNLARPKTNLGLLRRSGFFGIFGNIGVRFVSSDIGDADLAQLLLLRKDRALNATSFISAATADVAANEKPPTLITPLSSTPPKIKDGMSTQATAVNHVTTESQPPQRKESMPPQSSIQAAEMLAKRSTNRCIAEPELRMNESESQFRCCKTPKPFAMTLAVIL